MKRLRDSTNETLNEPTGAAPLDATAGRLMSAKDVIELGKLGWYWWRLKSGWPWRPIEVGFKNGEYLADNKIMDCPENRSLEIKGEFVGPIAVPDDA